MTKKQLKTKLIGCGYSQVMAKFVTQGRRKPRYETMLKLSHLVPFYAWVDIRAWLKEQEALSVAKFKSLERLNEGGVKHKIAFGYVLKTIKRPLERVK